MRKRMKTNRNFNKQDIMTKVLLIGALLVLSLFFYSIVFVTFRDYQYTLFVNLYSSNQQKLSYNLLVLGIALAIVITTIIIQKKEFIFKTRLSKYMENIDNYFQVKPYRRIYLYIAYAFLFCYLAHICYLKFTEGGWGSDLIQVYHIAYSKYAHLELPQDIQLYIERYPNNLAISWYEIIIFRIFNSPRIESVYIVNTVIELTLIVAISNQMFKQTRSIIKSIVPILLLLCFIPMLTYLSFPYTDNLGVFGIFFVYLLIQMKSWQKPWLFLLLSLPTGIFLSGRANVIVAVVALTIVVMLFYNSKKQNSKLLLKKVLLGLSFIFLSLFVMSTATSMMGKGLSVDVKKSAFPASHWLNMGQDEKLLGTYNHSDALKTQEIIETEGIAKASEYNLKNAIQRFQKRTIKQNWKFFTEKISYEWSSSDFSMLKNLIVFNGVTSNKYKELTSNPKIRYLNFFLDVFTRVIYLLLMFQTIYYIRNSKKLTPEFLFLVYAFSGTIIFYMLWENAERYGFIVMPIIVFGVIYEQMRILKIKDELPQQ